jgi:hypothetical protein
MLMVLPVRRAFAVAIGGAAAAQPQRRNLMLAQRRGIILAALSLPAIVAV